MLQINTKILFSHGWLESNKHTFRHKFGVYLPHQWMQPCIFYLESPEYLIIFAICKYFI